MADRNDGGPAFPTSSALGTVTGMSLRDWFAGQALAGMLAATARSMAPEEAERVMEAKAKYSYRYADAMLAARQPEQTGEANG